MITLLTWQWKIFRFFCAIEPEMRSRWAMQIQNLLKPDGELITLMFPVTNFHLKYLQILFPFANEVSKTGFLAFQII